MTAAKIIRLGHPALRKKSEPVLQAELKAKTFQIFLDKLVTACIENKGVGIAAPQVGVNKRVIVVFVDPANPRYVKKNPFPLTVVINPVVVQQSEAILEDWEGDLSVNLRGIVPRAATCVVEGWDREGKKVLYTLTDDFHARVFQHEIDHLDGIMFLDKVSRKESLSETAEYEKYWKNNKAYLRKVKNTKISS